MLNKKFQTNLALKLDIKLTFLENNACLVITAAIRHTSTEKLYQGLAQNLWSREIHLEDFHYYKILSEKSLSHLFNLIPILNKIRNARYDNKAPPIKAQLF